MSYSVRNIHQSKFNKMYMYNDFLPVNMGVVKKLNFIFNININYTQYQASHISIQLITKM